MCGIFCVYGDLPVVSHDNKLKHRGPDDFKTERIGKCFMAFSRLSINDTSTDGMQPFVSGESMLICNGEIYNHADLLPWANLKNDCACLLPLIKEHGITQVANEIKGVFAICYYDGSDVYAARDPIGVRPLFYAYTKLGTVIFASEIKAFPTDVFSVNIFPPGTVYSSKTGDFTRYYNYAWPTSSLSLFDPYPFARLRKVLTEAVRRRITNTERKVCFLLSGGLDSSLMVAIARQLLGKDAHIKTFSIGTEDSPDCIAARKVADYCKTDHTEVRFEPTEGLDSIYDVIRCLESYDTTTIRASVPMWLLSKYISEKTDYKVVISGEGSDEIFGGYLYFHNAPNVGEFVEENTRLLKMLHQYDVLRADRCTAAHGLEVRVPFLDRDFIDCAMGEINQSLKTINACQFIEKWVLRSSFEGYLPRDILWRQKNAFSDAVGYSWVDHIKRWAGTIVQDDKFEDEIIKSNNFNVPLTKEEAMYRSVFAELYTDPHIISEIWRPRWTEQTDPSATLLKQHLK